MAALGLDTSVIVRFLTGEPADLAEAARERIGNALQEGHELVVADMAVAETYYVLQKIYGVPKKAVITALLDLFQQPGFRPEANGIAVHALTESASSHAPGLVARMPQEIRAPSKAGPAAVEAAWISPLQASTISPLVPMSTSIVAPSSGGMRVVSMQATVSPPTNPPMMGNT